MSPELTLSAIDLPLNTGLVAVTGGRGSGKTALVDLLAHCFVNRAETEDLNSFVRRVKDSGAPFGTQLTFLSGETFTKDLLGEQFVEESTVVYIAQGELERYIGEKSDLNHYIHSLIFSSDEIRETSDAFEYEKLADVVNELQADLDAKNQQIDQFEQATAIAVESELKKEGQKAKAEVEDLKKRVADAELKLSKEKIESTEARQKALDGLKNRRQRFLTARELATEAVRFIDSDLPTLAGVVDRLNVLVVDLAIGGPLAAATYSQRQQLVDLAKTIDEQVRPVVADIEKQERELRGLALEQREHATLLNKKRDMESRHKALQERWRSLLEAKGALQKERADRSELLRRLYETVEEQRRKYAEIILRFSKAKDRVLHDLDFEAEIVVDSEGLKAEADVVVDRRSVDVRGERGDSVFHVLLDGLGKLAQGDSTTIPMLVSETDRLAADLSVKLKHARTIGPLNLYRLLYHSYLAVRPVVRYRRTALDRLSLGQKATVLMKIYLAEGDKPIIIDSHDDHLDNESIMEELVGALRQAKNYRQVILASNNGNVVVNSDAEQLIVAKHSDGVISYAVGSLENPGIRDRALTVLEGGREAFRRRQEKYRIGGDH